MERPDGITKAALGIFARTLGAKLYYEVMRTALEWIRTQNSDIEPSKERNSTMKLNAKFGIPQTVCLFFFLTVGGPIPTFAAQEVRIGVLTSLSGPFSTYGNQQVGAVMLAAEEINAAGGIRGAPITVIIHDTVGAPEKALQAMRSLAFESKVVAVLGPLSSTESTLAFPFANKVGIPIITASASAPEITVENRPWTFRTSLTPKKLYTDAIRRWAAHAGIKTVAIVFDKSDRTIHGESTVLIPQILARNGIKLITQTSFLRGELDFTVQVSSIKKANPDGVIIHGSPFDTANILRKLRKQGFDKPIYAARAPFPQLGVGDIGPGIGEDFYFAVPFWVGEQNPRAMEFVEKLRVKGILRVSSGAEVSTSAQIYDAVYAIKSVLEKSGVRPGIESVESNRKIIKEGWSKLQEFSGVAGTYSVDKNGDIDRKTYLVTTSKGQYRLVE